MDTKKLIEKVKADAKNRILFQARVLVSGAEKIDPELQAEIGGQSYAAMLAAAREIVATEAKAQQAIRDAEAKARKDARAVKDAVAKAAAAKELTDVGV